MKTTKQLNDGRVKLTKNNIKDGYIREFINNDYIIGMIQPIDMFPHTHHIECVITLDNKND